MYGPLPVGLSAAEAIEPLKRVEMGPGYETYAFALARSEADPALLPALYEIAEARRCLSDLALMVAIEASGAPSAYFLDYARRHGPLACDVASQAIGALGVRSDPTVAAEVRAVAAEVQVTTSRPARTCRFAVVSLYERLVERDRAYQALSPEEQAERVVPSVVRSVFGLAVGEDGAVVTEFSYGDSIAEEWDRRRVSILGQRHPDLVRAVAERVAAEEVEQAQRPPPEAVVELFRRAEREDELEATPERVLRAWEAGAVAEVERLGIEGNPPAPYVPGPSGSVSCDSRQATIYVSDAGLVVGGPRDGERYDGKLEGTDGPDVIVGTDGKDKVEAGDGDDVVCGLGGDDDLKGGAGDDTLLGGAGDDKLDGKDGRDTLVGGAGDDDLKGGRGDDTLDGGPGRDKLAGGDGDDELSGGDGDDELKGGGQDDTLVGGPGTDRADGGGDTDLCAAETEKDCEGDPPGAPDDE